MAAPTVCEVRLHIGEQTQVAFQLPAASPLSVVLGDVETYLGEYLDAAGALDKPPDATRGWRLRTAAGTLLDNDKSLTEQAVRSGSALALIAEPEGEEFTPRIENVSAAVAGLSRKLFAAVTPESVSAMMIWFTTALVGAALTLLGVADFQSRNVAVAASVAVAAVAAAVGLWLNARRYRRNDLRDALCVLVLCFGPTGLSLLIPPSFGSWGAPHLVVAATAAAAFSGFAAARGWHVRTYTAATVIAGLVAASQLASLHGLVPGKGTICVLVIALVVLLGRAELLAARLARLPVSMFPSGSGRFIGRGDRQPGEAIEPTPPPDPAALLDAALRANEMLAGLLIGLAAAAAGLTTLIVATRPMQWPWLAFAAGIPVLFAYRSWYYAARANVLYLLLGVFGSVIGAAAALAATVGVWSGVGLLAVTAVCAVLAPRAVPTEDRPHPPLVRGLRVVSEYVVTLAVLLAPLGLLHIPQMVYNRDFQWHAW